MQQRLDKEKAKKLMTLSPFSSKRLLRGSDIDYKIENQTKAKTPDIRVNKKSLVLKND